MRIRPDVVAGDWIDVGDVECVVVTVYAQPSTYGVCKVVFNKSKPTTHDVDWGDSGRFFPERPDYGGYARDSNPFVLQLRRGRRYQEAPTPLDQARTMRAFLSTTPVVYAK